jgi:hypothetical protein
MVEHWTAFLWDIAESCRLVGVYPSFEVQQIWGGMFTFRAPCMPLSVSHYTLWLGNINCWMRTLYSDANGERDKVGWLVGVSCGWLFDYMNIWMIGSSFNWQMNVYDTTFIPWLVCNMLAHLIAWIVCKMSTQFSWYLYDLFIIGVVRCLFICLLYGVVSDWLSGRSIVVWMIGILLGTKWWNILLLKFCYLVVGLVFDDLSVRSHQLHCKNLHTDSAVKS